MLAIRNLEEDLVIRQEEALEAAETNMAYHSLVFKLEAPSGRRRLAATL